MPSLRTQEYRTVVVGGVVLADVVPEVVRLSRECPSVRAVRVWLRSRNPRSMRLRRPPVPARAEALTMFSHRGRAFVRRGTSAPTRISTRLFAAVARRPSSCSELRGMSLKAMEAGTVRPALRYWQTRSHDPCNSCDRVPRESLDRTAKRCEPLQTASRGFPGSHACYLRYFSGFSVLGCPTNRGARI